MIVMFNPTEHIVIVTNTSYQSRWEELGFIRKESDNDE